MGRKVTVDSATLMNKGLELIEARWLFDLDPSELDVLIHPQSVVHALVEMTDGSVLAQLGATDMRLPIQYALTWPERRDSGLPALDLARIGRLEFHRVDERRFPLFGLARQALSAGGSLPVALNAANEVAVAAFLEKRIAVRRHPGGRRRGHGRAPARPGRFRRRDRGHRHGRAARSPPTHPAEVDMGNILGTLLAFTIVFGILVFVHEFGHFFMAKLVGVRVEVFLLRLRQAPLRLQDEGETDYRISLIPDGRLRQAPGRGDVREGPARCLPTT